MKRMFVLGFLLLCAASPAAAQSEGRVSVGASVVFAKPTDSEVQSLHRAFSAEMSREVRALVALEPLPYLHASASEPHVA